MKRDTHRREEKLMGWAGLKERLGLSRVEEAT